MLEERPQTADRSQMRHWLIRLQRHHLWRSAVNLSRFDRVALVTLLGLALLTLLLVWRGDQIGVQVVAVSPAEGATEVSTWAVMQVTFDQKIAAIGSGFPLSVSPPVSGTLRWEEA